jgi:hypothetical protein
LQKIVRFLPLAFSGGWRIMQPDYES